MIPRAVVTSIVERALEEDLGGGDPTTEATVDEGATAIGRAVAKAEIIVCGGDVFRAVFAAVDPSLRVTVETLEGARAVRGDILWTVRGPARAILMGERTALNFVQRLSGIATLARRYMDALPPGSRTRVTDTRKTTPGLRVLERYAVRTGGASNHRDTLSSAVLIKDNHIVAAGGIGEALRRARRFSSHTSKIEIEVESLEALDDALAGGADIVMLDNFAPAEVEEAVKRAAGRALVEVSGNVTVDRLPELSRLGVNVVSVGALTHSAPAGDIGLDIERL
jgi:nicotinate-nucleotide pyrophosphorylase (carboxylating)